MSPRRYRAEIEAYERARQSPAGQLTAYYQTIDPAYRPLFGPGGRYSEPARTGDVFPREVPGHFADDAEPAKPPAPVSDGWYPPPPGGTWCVAHGPTCGMVQEPETAPRANVLDLLFLRGAAIPKE